MPFDVFSLAAILLKFLMYLAGLGASGLLLFRVAMSGQQSVDGVVSHRLIVFGALTGLTVTVLGLGLGGAQLTGSLSGMMDLDLIGVLWSSPVGTVVQMRLVGFAALLFVVTDTKWSYAIGLLGSGIILWSFALVGHVSNVEAFGVSVLLLLHLVGLSFWIGALHPLYVAAKTLDLDTSARLSHRFGHLATFAVPILIAAGLVIAWLLVGSFGALFGTSYGLVLVIKLILVGAVLVFATLNKLRFVPAMQAGKVEAAQHFLNSIRLEMALIGFTLLATAVLTSALPLPE